MYALINVLCEEKKTHIYLQVGWAIFFLEHVGIASYKTWLSPNKRTTLLKTNSSPPVGEDLLPQVETETPNGIGMNRLPRMNFQVRTCCEFHGTS